MQSLLTSYFRKKRFNSQNEKPFQLLSKETETKIYGSLVDYVHKQITAGLISTIFCASVILIGLFHTVHRGILFFWYITLISLTLIRFILAHVYQTLKLTDHDKRLWGKSFVFFAALAGICWGFVGTLLFPSNVGLQQILIILILGGVTAGSVPLFSGILRASIIFLMLTILPVSIHLILLGKEEYLLVASTMFLYLIYLVVLSIQFHRLIAQTIYFEFKNDQLLNELMIAKNELEISNKQLEHSATHDHLTAIPNRNLFTIKLQDAIKRVERQNKMLGLFYIDLDKFKQVNDTYGHHIGDKLLQHIVNRIQNAIRNDDIIARLGGDEFTVILENIDSIEPLKVVAAKICSAFNKPLLIDQISIRITVTIGISTYPKDGQDPEALTVAADSAMYKIKLIHPGTYGFFVSEQES